MLLIRTPEDNGWCWVETDFSHDDFHGMPDWGFCTAGCGRGRRAHGLGNGHRRPVSVELELLGHCNCRRFIEGLYFLPFLIAFFFMFLFALLPFLIAFKYLLEDPGRSNIRNITEFLSTVLEAFSKAGT